MPFRQFMCFSHPHVISKWHPGSMGQGGGGDNVSKAKMCNFLCFVTDNFKDINCRIVNIHGRISGQTGVRVSICYVDVFIDIQYRFTCKFAFNLCVLH